MNCKTARHEIERVAETLDFTAHDELTGHLATCPRCAREYAETEAVARGLKKELDAVAAPAAFRASVLDQLPRPRVTHLDPSVSRSSPRIPGARLFAYMGGVAALVVLAVGAFLVVARRQPPGAVVREVEGMVRLWQATAPGPIEATVGTHVRVGGTLRTGAEATAEIVLGKERVRAKLHSKTRLTVERLDEGPSYVLHLETGGVDVAVRRAAEGGAISRLEFRLSTPAGSVQVTGTRFSARLVDRAAMLVVRVLEGSVVLTNPNGSIVLRSNSVT